jgi:hypothetical protein
MWGTVRFDLTIATVLLVILVHGCVPTTPTSPYSRRTPRVPTLVEDQKTDLLIKEMRAHEGDATPVLHQQKPVVTKSVALIWSPEKTPALKDLLLRSSTVTINTILLELSDKQLKKSAQTASNALLNDPLFGWIDSAQKMGFRVFLITPFRFATGYAETSFTKEVDIFDPAVKKRLLSFYRDIVRYPLNGVYVNDISYGIKEGMTPYAIATYQDLFSERLQTASLRFAGLRSRHITKLLNDIWAEIQLGSSEIEFGISVPEILLMDPTKGLIETSLDYLELKEAQFDFYVVGSMESGAQRVSESLLKYGKLEKVWFYRTRKETIISLLEMPIQGVIGTAP